MAKKRKPHALDQSSLYRLGSKSKLATILGLPSVQALDSLIEAGDARNFRAYEENDGRPIEYPLDSMADCHEKLAKLLRRIKVPDYVHSQKERSYVSNAKAHATGSPVAKTDISKYFPSTSFAHVQRFFRDDLKCPPDVTWYLTKICTYSGHIPTGSTISNSLAFLANRPMFDQIYCLTAGKGCVMTLLQDDIIISGTGASKKLLNEIQMIVRRWGLRTSPKRKKTKTYPAASAKILTGVLVKGNAITLPNRRRKMLAESYQVALKAKTKADRAVAVAKLRGRINEADQIDSSAVDPRHRRLAGL